MHIARYLERINVAIPTTLDAAALIHLHFNHVFHVPFENVDVHYKKRFDLELENIYQKVVHANRGGFCYELNLLFNELLQKLGFNSRIISASIYTESGEPGPRFDHMAICVSA